MNDGHVKNVRPAAAPVEVQRSGSAADAYRRAAKTRPTNFGENPIGAMALAMDRIGKAAGTIMQKGDGAQQSAIAHGEDKLRAAAAAAQANPKSLKARQEHLKAAATLLRDMQQLAPNHPKRVRLATLVVGLATSLGPNGIPFNVPGLDMRGLLQLAAGVVSRYGDASGMQKAFGLEQLLRSSLTGSSPEAIVLRDRLFQQFQVSRNAAQIISGGWKVRLTGAGETPQTDVSARTISINAAQTSPSLAAIAKAYWHDTSLRNPANKDGFIEAFVKIANSGSFSILQRKYKEVRRMARHQIMSTPNMSTIGGTGGVVAVNRRAPRPDESGDMFAALAVFSRTPEGRELPPAVDDHLQRFFMER